MSQIQLNHPGRDKVKPLTVEQEKEVLEILNSMLFENQDLKLLQRLISNYENLCHYKACTANIDKKLEAAEKEISNLTIDLNNCGQSLQREYKRNSELLNALKEMLFMTDGNCKNIGKCKTLSEAEALAKQAIENNK